MKNRIIFLLSLCLLAITFSCKKTCKTCTLCKSFYANGVQANEAKECNADTTYINGYNDGFILGATESGKTALCFDQGVECKTKRQWNKE